MIEDVEALERDVRQLLARMEMLSEAKSANVDASPGKQKPGSKHLTHNGPVLADLWVRRFEDHWDDPDALERLLRAGKEALKLRQHTPKLHDVVESEDFILLNYEGVDADTVAMVETERGAFCSTKYVLWLRRKNDLTDTGYPRPPSNARVRLAMRLRDEGLNQVKIAKYMGVSQPTVSRIFALARKEAEPWAA